jgi:hypothetical protein
MGILQYIEKQVSMITKVIEWFKTAAIGAFLEFQTLGMNFSIPLYL